MRSYARRFAQTMRIINLNPDTNIGASAWFVEMESHRLLMDAGIHPKLEGRASLPMFDVINGKDLDAIAISHCHHDHVGSLPVALRHFPSAHTNPVFVVVKDQPIRPSRRSVEWCLASVDQCWNQKERTYLPPEKEMAKQAYDHAREVYRARLGESAVD